MNTESAMAENGSNAVNPSVEMFDPEKEKPRRCRCEFAARTRYIILVLATLCLSSVWSNILTFNFTVICMGPKQPAPTDPNQTLALHPFLGRTGTEREKRDVTVKDVFTTVIPVTVAHDSSVVTTSEYDYSPTQKTFLIGAVAVGAIISLFPVTIMINKKGPRRVFAGVGLLSALATALIPLGAHLGLVYFLILRAIQGIAFAACFPVVGGVTAKWATLKQNGLFISILTSFLQLAPSFTNPVAGALCTSTLGWQSVYYFHAAGSFIVFSLFAVFYQNTPKNHPFVGQRELDKIAAGKAKSAANKKAARNVPYLAIFKTVSVYAVWLAGFSNFSGTNLVMLYSPTYLNKVMNFPVSQTGLSSALPPLVQFVVKLISGLTSDKVRCFPETLKVKVYNTVAFFGMAAFFIGLAFIPNTSPMTALGLLICGTSILGFNTGGFYKSATLVGRHYSQFVMSIVQMMLCITMLIVPVLVGGVAPNNTVAEWNIVWYIYAGMLIVGNIIFVIFGKGTPARWARDPVVEDSNDTNQYSMGKSSVATIVPIGINIENVKPAY